MRYIKVDGLLKICLPIYGLKSFEILSLDNREVMVHIAFQKQGELVSMVIPNGRITIE